MIVKEHIDFTLYTVNSEEEFSTAYEFAKANRQTQQYTIRIEVDDKIISYSFDKEELIEKNEVYLDSDGNEIKLIEYNNNNEIKRIVEYENYSSGESKWIRSYDSEGNLLSEDFYEEDFWED